MSIYLDKNGITVKASDKAVIEDQSLKDYSDTTNMFLGCPIEITNKPLSEQVIGYSMPLH